jgi:formamidase
MRSCGGKDHYIRKGYDMEKVLGLGACQISTRHGDIEGNLKLLDQSIKAIKSNSPWVSLVCAHELCIQGTADMESVAQEIPGSISERCSALARKYGIYLVPGSLYEKRDGIFYNTAAVFDPQGNLIASYRKLYPWKPIEKTTPGRKTMVFDISDCRIGVCICYDLWFPEVIRDLAWKGAEVVLIPTSTTTPDRNQEIILARAAAIANQCFIVSVNGTGRGGIGRSLMVDPEGNIMQMTGQVPENMSAILDLARVKSIRENGTCGVTRPLASFFHEQHRFEYQDREYASSPVFKELDLWKK